MSAEAVKHVVENAPFGGAKLLVCLAIAIQCKKRTAPFWAQASTAEIAKFTRTCQRNVKFTLAELRETGALVLWKQGKGQVANAYELAFLRQLPQKRGDDFLPARGEEKITPFPRQPLSANPARRSSV